MSFQNDRDPSAPLEWMRLALKRESNGELEGAIAPARKAVEAATEPGAGGGRSPSRLLGRLLIEACRYEDAVTALEPAIKSDTDGVSHTLLGVAFRNLGRIEDAKRAHQKAIALNPSNEEALFNYAVCLRGEAPVEALNLLEQCVKIDPDYAPALRELGKGLYCEYDELQRSESLLRRAIAIDGKDPWSHSYLAYLLVHSDRLEEAEAHWLRAAELSPQWDSPPLELGLIYQALGRHEEAETMLRKGIELSPCCSEIWFHLGWFLLDVARREEGEPCLRRALELDPLNARAKKIEELLAASDNE